MESSIARKYAEGSMAILVSPFCLQLFRASTLFWGNNTWRSKLNFSFNFIKLKKDFVYPNEVGVSRVYCNGFSPERRATFGERCIESTWPREIKGKVVNEKWPVRWDYPSLGFAEISFKSVSKSIFIIFCVFSYQILWRACWWFIDSGMQSK